IEKRVQAERNKLKDSGAVKQPEKTIKHNETEIAVFGLKKQMKDAPESMDKEFNNEKKCPIVRRDSKSTSESSGSEDINIGEKPRITYHRKAWPEIEKRVQAERNKLKDSGAVKQPKKTIEHDETEIAIHILDRQMKNLLESIIEKSNLLFRDLGDVSRFGELLEEKQRIRNNECYELEKIQSALNQLVESRKKRK
ncbi:hypothetical protein COBT_003404, partial [Conglomerata obtusa]